jgi:hypothetical protein
MKTRLKRLTLLLFLFSLWGTVMGQVTIGDGIPPQDFSVLEVSTKDTRGGLRLPQLNTDDRDSWRDYFLGKRTDNPVNTGGSGVSDDELLNAPGLAIFNTDTQCYEYWNGLRWVSLCEGDSQLTISPDPCPDVLADGTGCDQEFTVTDPDCETGPFSFAIIIGGDYAALTDVDELNGRFHITFRENNTTRPRTVVVRVTSSCTGLSKDFMFIQQKQECNPALGAAPEIIATPAGSEISYCMGGAVILSVPADTPNLDVLIWTLNGIEIARGVNFLEVTREGRYDVHMGVVGCNQRDGNAKVVRRDGMGAPLKPSVVVLGNNGLVCGPGGKTQLVALNPNSGGTVLWFKDGVPQDGKDGRDEITGTQVEVGVGEWFAVVQDGQCQSRKSETVSVKEDPSTGETLTRPGIDLGGEFCAGSTKLLKVTDETYNSTYIYTWYENNTQIGTGRFLLYTVPVVDQMVVIRCRATKPGSCAMEALSVEQITQSPVPPMPGIAGNTILCSGSTTLTVTPATPGTYTYTWYKDNTPLGNDPTSPNLTVTEGGNYYATVTDGCTSPMAHVNIPAVSSAAPVVTLNSSSTTPGTVNIGDEVTYTAVINFGPATKYKWEIPTGLATLGYGTTESQSVTLKYTTAGTGTLKVTVENACGPGVFSLPVNVKNDCADVRSVTATEPYDIKTVAGVPKVLGPVYASFTEGTPAPTYQWYRSSSNGINDRTQPVGEGNNTLNVTINEVTTAYYYCMVGNKECPDIDAKASPVYTVEVYPYPALNVTGECSICGTGVFSPSATPTTPNTEARWYTAATGGTPIPAPSPGNVSSTTTYYAAAYSTVADWESPVRTPVRADVWNQSVSASINNPQPGYGAVPFTLTGSAENGTFYWQTSSNGTSTAVTNNPWQQTMSNGQQRWGSSFNALCNPQWAYRAVTAQVTTPTTKHKYTCTTAARLVNLNDKIRWSCTIFINEPGHWRIVDYSHTTTPGWSGTIKYGADGAIEGFGPTSVTVWMDRSHTYCAQCTSFPFSTYSRLEVTVAYW